MNGKYLIKQRFTESIILNQTINVINEALYCHNTNQELQPEKFKILDKSLLVYSSQIIIENKYTGKSPRKFYRKILLPYAIHTIHTPVSANRFVVPIVEHLKKFGFITNLWVPENKSAVKDATLSLKHQNKCAVRSINCDISLNPLVLFLIRFIVIVKALIEKRPDVLHAHIRMRSSTMPLLASWMLRVPVRIYHNHGLPYLGHSGIIRSCLKLIERINIFDDHRLMFLFGKSWQFE